MQRPYNEMQVATWILVPLILGGFYGLALPVLEDALKFIAVPYFIFNLISVYCAMQVCASDPADPRVWVNKRYRKRAEVNPDVDDASPLMLTCIPCERLQSPDPRLNDQAGIYFCVFCQVHVSNQSYHCSTCNKCVHRLDHHCQWLNNCIGSLNYKYFFGVLSSTLIFTTMQLVLFVVLLWRYFSSSYFSEFRERVEEVHAIPHQAFIALVCFFIVVLLPVVVSIAQLFQFHLVLIHKKMTTLEYVTQVTSSIKSATLRSKPAPPPASSPPRREHDDDVELGRHGGRGSFEAQVPGRREEPFDGLKVPEERLEEDDKGAAGPSTPQMPPLPPSAEEAASAVEKHVVSPSEQV